MRERLATTATVAATVAATITATITTIAAANTAIAAVTNLQASVILV
jgi:hypothetical protein